MGFGWSGTLKTKQEVYIMAINCSQWFHLVPFLVVSVGATPPLKPSFMVKVHSHTQWNHVEFRVGAQLIIKGSNRSLHTQVDICTRECKINVYGLILRGYSLHITTWAPFSHLLNEWWNRQSSFHTKLILMQCNFFSHFNRVKMSEATPS